ncbi:MAG TPA: DUF4282 domain-containing protein [Parvularculaceae bacterium]|nr:DUF4282 domain-containing protein [Parvularculaceae bacterium]
MFLFSFRRFIAPTVIKFFYYLGLLVLILGGLGTIVYGLTEIKELGFLYAMRFIVGALIGTPLAILTLRFSTEMWLVLFEMNARLGQIRDK